MCGRYAFSYGSDELRAFFDLATSEEYPPHYNVAPTQQAPIIRESSPRELVTARWGLIPHWADPSKLRSNLINARSETAAQKPSFRDSLPKRRCIVPATAFYEWKMVDGRKQPFAIRRRDGKPLALGGMWTRNTRGTEPIESYTILTTEPNDLMRELHDRMPLVLSYDAVNRWLDPSIEDVSELLRPSDPDELEAYPVSPAVGNIRNNGPQLIERLPQE